MPPIPVNFSEDPEANSVAELDSVGWSFRHGFWDLETNMTGYCISPLSPLKKRHDWIIYFLFLTICHFSEIPFPCHHWTVYIINAFLNLLDDENVCCSGGQWERLKVCEASSNTPSSTIQSCQGKLDSSSGMTGVKERC